MASLAIAATPKPERPTDRNVFRAPISNAESYTLPAERARTVVVTVCEVVALGHAERPLDKPTRPLSVYRRHEVVPLEIDAYLYLPYVVVVELEDDERKLPQKKAASDHKK